MIPHHLTFSTSRDALCPLCNGILATGTWTIRGGLALCISCAAITTVDNFRKLQALVSSHGKQDFARSHSVSFFTPPPHFPKTVVWALWVDSPANITPDTSA